MVLAEAIDQCGQGFSEGVMRGHRRYAERRASLLPSAATFATSWSPSGGGANWMWMPWRLTPTTWPCWGASRSGS